MQSFPILMGSSCTIGNVVTMPNSKLHLLPGFQFEKLHASWYLCSPLNVKLEVTRNSFFFVENSFLPFYPSLHCILSLCAP